MKIRDILTIIIFAICANSFAKRVAPEKVEPLIHGNFVYIAPHFINIDGTNQNGGYIEVLDAKSGVKLWGLLVYKTEYDPDLENDTQDVFITSLSINFLGTKLTVTDELGRQYDINISDKSVTKTK